MVIPMPGRTEPTFAERYLCKVPYEWTESQRIPVPFEILDELAQYGFIEMNIRKLERPNGMVCGCRHSFRRLRMKAAA